MEKGRMNGEGKEEWRREERMTGEGNEKWRKKG